MVSLFVSNFSLFGSVDFFSSNLCMSENLGDCDNDFKT